MVELLSQELVRISTYGVIQSIYQSIKTTTTSILLSLNYILSKKWLFLYGFEKERDTNTNSNIKHNKIFTKKWYNCKQQANKGMVL